MQCQVEGGGAPGSQPFDLGLKCIYAGLIDIDEL